MTNLRARNAFRGAIAFAAILLAASTGWAKLQVVTTLSDYGALVEVLGGDHVEVQVLSSPLEDPHYVDAKPSFIIELHRADWLIANGLELEIGWLPKLVVQSRNPRIQAGESGHLEVGAYVTNILDVQRGPVDRSMGDIHGGGNPHFYHDPIRMLELLPLFANRLMELDPAHQEAYQKNLSRVQSELKALIVQLRKQFQALPTEKRKVVAYHKSFEYLFETLGLEVVAYLEPKPGVAPTPSHVAKVLSLMKRHNVRVIFQESYYPSRTSSALASLAGAKVVKVSGGTAAGQSYIAHSRERATRLYQALKGATP